MVRAAAIAIGLVLVGGLPSSAATVKTTSAGWDIETVTSELDGKVEVSAAVNSTTTSPDVIGQPKATILAFICRDGRLSHIVSFPRRVASYRAGTIGAKWRFDDAAIQTDNWPAINASAGYMLRNDRAQAFLDSAAAAKRLVVQIDTNEAVFDLTGADVVRDAVRAQCAAK